MGADDFQLVKALMNRNEEMRVIAVGDDDQNIYGFRGSDSRYLQSMIDDQGATLYEMTTNYRSTSAIVDFSNRFATLLPARMKKSSCTAFSQDKGIVQVHQYDSKGFLAEVIEVVQQAGLTEGTTCLLTPTNEEALQAAYLLEQQGLHTRLIQSIGGFSFHQLAEIRYFLKQLSGNVGSALTQKQWDEAKERTLQGAPVGELITHQLAWYEPSDENAGKEAAQGKEQLSGDKVEPVKQRTAKHHQPVDST